MNCLARLRLAGLCLGLVLAASLILSAAQVPRPAPPFTINLLNGQTLNIQSLKGKVVIVEILLTTCPHCQKTTQVLTKIYEEYAPKGLAMVGVALDPVPAIAIPEFVQKFNVRYPIGHAPRNQIVEFLQHPPMLRLLVPQLVFIDKKGIIRAQHVGNEDFFKDEETNIRNLVEKLLQEK